MKAQDLKNSVLQLAIQGKLVEQNPNDESASILLEKIKSEKEQLIKDKKIKREKPLPEITEEEKPFEIPDTWEWVRLSDITTCITCGLASTPNYVDDGKMFLSAKNVKPHKFMPYDYKMISQEDYDKLTKNSKPELNDILLTRVGAGIGEAAIIDKDLDFAIYVSLTLIKPIHKYIYAPYLLNWISSPNGRENCLSNIYGKKASQGNLNVNLVRGFVIPLPPLEEQKRIVAKIEEVLEKIEEYDKAEKELSQLEKAFPQDMKKSILQYAIQGKLVEQNPNDEPACVLLEKIKAEKEKLIKEKKIKKEKPLPEISEEEKSFEIPDSWEWVRLGDIVQLLNGRAYKKNELLLSGKTPVLRVGNFFTNNSWYYSDLILEENKYCNKGDLLYAWSASFGPKIWNGERAIYHYHIWKINIFADINKEYLYYMLLDDVNKIKSITNGSTMVHVTKEKMEKRIFPLPPLEEQKRIVAKIDKFMNYIDKLQDKINNQDMISKLVQVKSIEVSESKELISN